MNVFVGRTPAIERLVADVQFDELGTDGIVIRTVDANLVLTGGRPRGVLFAVHSFLQDVVGVVPGEPAALSFSLEEDELEAGDTTETSVVVTDEYGNEIDADWTITVDGSGEATVDGGDVTFEEEGTYEVTASVDGTDGNFPSDNLIT